MLTSTKMCLHLPVNSVSSSYCNIIYTFFPREAVVFLSMALEKH